ncbi:MAG: ATP-binding protein [Bacteroidota bacterium]
MMHKLLERQVKKLKRKAKEGEFPLEALLEVVSSAYEEQDEERRKKDHTVATLTQELTELNQKIKDDAEGYVSAIMENVVDGILTFDSEGKILSVNSAAQEIFGYIETELQGEQIHLLLPDENHEKATGLLTALEEIISGTKASFSAESLALKKDGHIFPTEVSISKMSGSNGDIFITIIKDITLRIQFQEELILAKEKAEAAAIAKTNFLSTMSHEIRTPMNAVIGLTNLLIQENPRQDQLDNLNVLKFSGENLLVLINDILDFNKIEAGRVDFEEIDFSLKTVANTIKEALGVKARDKGIGLRIYMDSALPEVVLGDPTRLSQILNNLIGNAVKFTEKGKVTVDIALREEKDDKLYIDFEVEDTGIGIPEDKIASVFESFTQSNSTITRKYGGTGLGLSITKRLIELQGSEIKLKSELGVGSKFYFTLPLKKSRRKAIQEESRESAPLVESLKGVKVLLVEDNKVNQMVAKKFLSHWGIEVEIAENGLIATELVRQLEFDIILMDLHMPVMDGYTATKTIRSFEEERFQNIPIIALTASVLQPTQKGVREVGMTDFVSKPFKPEELNSKIAKYVLGAIEEPEETKAC